MNNLFLFLLLVSLIGLVVGLIKPSTVKMKSRKSTALYFGGAIVVFFVLFGVTSSTPQVRPTAQTPDVAAQQAPNPIPAATPQQPAQTTTAVPAPVALPSEENQIKAIVANILQGKTNMSNEARLRDVKIDQQPDGGWAVLVSFNGNENLTLGLTKSGIEKDMSDIYIALYTSGKNIDTVQTVAYLQLTDKYGNTSDGMAYRSVLDKATAAKVNWSADKATLELQILPGVWQATYINQSFR